MEQGGAECVYRPRMIGVGVNTWVWTSPFTAGSVELIARAQTFGFDSITLPVEEPGTLDGEAVSMTEPAAPNA